MKKGKIVGKIVKAGLFVFVTLIAFELIQLQIDIHKQSQYYAALQKEIDQKKIVVEEITQKVNVNGSDYYEDVARSDLGYAYPGERIFIDVSGN